MTAQSKSAQVLVGDWRVDLSANALGRGDAVVRLEPRVMRLFGCLIAHAGEVMTRARLMNEVWGAQVVEDDALSAAVIKLRKALGDNALAHVGRLQEARVAVDRYRQMRPVGTASERRLPNQSR